MSNPKTTIPGYLMLAASLIVLVAHIMTGGLVIGDVTAVMGALGGIGLVCAKDGGH